VRVGDLDLTLVSDGTFRLDGGAMFGVVPRTLWGKAKPPDEQNRIRMGTNCLLLARGSDLLLIDAGIGDKVDEKFREIYGMDPAAVRLPASMAAAGFELGDVTHVLLSHLHFDHCGWSTREVSGKLVPTFPRARYFLARGEVEHARHPNERDRASYLAPNWEPLFAAGVAELFDDEIEPLPGVRAVRAPGHNRDMCIVLLDGGAPEKAVFWADLVPTTAHVPIPWIMSYDLYPLETLESKKLWLAKAAAEGWLGVFEHDADVPLARVIEERPGRFKAVPVAAPEGAGTVVSSQRL
jgi:glyoxylase-like metal-dependent hydrolase (beta-lactamase superfamily II)